MAPSGAGSLSSALLTMYSTPVTIRSTPFELVTSSLSESRLILLTNLLVWLLTLVSGIFLGLRLFAIWYRKLVLVIDDGLLIAAWVAVLFYAATTSLELAAGASTSDSADGAAAAVTLLDNAARTLALTAVAWSKSAFACGLLGLRPVRTYRWGLLALVGVLNAVVVGAAVFHWVRCRPIARAWDGDVEGGFCFGVDARNGVQIAAQAYFAFMDMVLVGISYTLVWSGTLRRGEKAGIGMLAIQGLLASVASMMTAVEISTLTDTTTTFISNIRVLLPASLEAPLTIIIACLPALQLLRTGHHHSPRKYAFGLSSAPPSVTGTTASAAGPSGPATPTSNPFAGFRPPRPARPSSARSFMTEASSRSHPQKKPAATDRWMMTMEPGNAIITTNITGGAAAKVSSPIEDLLPGIEYDYKRWNPGKSTSNANNANPSPATPSFPVVAPLSPPSSRGVGLAPTMATTLPAINTTSTNKNNNYNTPAHLRPNTGRSTTSNNSTTALLAAREYLSTSPQSSSSSILSPPSSPTYSPLPPSSAGNGGLFPRPPPLVIPTNTVDNDENNNINNRRLTIVREEAAAAAATNANAAVPSWGSSAVRSSADGAASLLDLYTTNANHAANGNGNENPAPAGAHLASRSRDSPTLGDWSGWAASGWQKREREEDNVHVRGAFHPGMAMQQRHQQQQRFPVRPSGRPLHARHRLPPETGPTAPTGWTQKMFGEQV